MAEYVRNGVRIDDTFAEAFGMRATRLLVTADHPRWAHAAAASACGFATSVIGCGCEAGVEAELDPAATPDGRPGVALLLFAVSREALAEQVERRVGQCLLTCPTTAVYAGIEGEDRIPLGRRLRYFGDGHQRSKVVDGRRLWRIPVMEGEFLIEDDTAAVRAIGGGNLLILARTRESALLAAESAVAAARAGRGAILPFPGGVVRSGSKVGARRYPKLGASTNDAFCPSLRGSTDSALEPQVGCVLELVFDALTEADMQGAMRAALAAICARGGAGGVLRVSAGNYGGKLGKYHFHLRDILPEQDP
ncbi:MAG: formylmethanofuran--tetrahydromethanopterin N-formyltransferase [Nevskia sp.]|nr:formylmethanofuran--tetrahydromethanopterin N-formyltransferase [Nevskia sp.]